MATTTSRRDRRRQLRRATRRRVRGGHNKAPVALQKAARAVDDTAWTLRSRVGRALGGNRPFVLGYLVILALGVALVSGPLQAFLDQRARLDLLTEQVEVVSATNDDLERRRRDLDDVNHIEQLARENLGLVRPGEVPYVIVPPQQERPAIAATFEVAPPDTPWYLRVWEAMTGVFG